MKISPRGLEFVNKPVDRDIEYENFTKQIQNSKELYDKVKSSGWVEDGFEQHNSKLKRISYKLNSFGFRCDSEFHKNEKGIIFLGCSDTFGWSQYKEKTWPWLVSQHFNKPCWNLGVTGGSVSTSYRVLKSHIDSVDVDYVCLLSPHSFRSETYYRHDKDIRKVFILPNMDFKKYPWFIEESYKKIWTLEENYELEYLKSLDAIQGICSRKGIELIHIENPTHIDYENEISKSIRKEVNINPSLSENYARDGHHAGDFFQRKISEYFINEIIIRTKE